ncbi:hypothetical protein AQPE_4244 [Aquipluma nitroreducens]|uniref:Uncharacterized protein n=1 Tax=Aquipluma nitroreducens TaxID=2010828 RepID=A0A5K7SES8_9BACT|nr:hypothetical protein [Aquipluma nitroreducens]BBE20053.1 hypothetical protein AQPE_4244 [Aquipluma nitroreducens]
MDYLVVGSNGFAQVGDLDYFTKAKIELRVLLDFLQRNYPVPDEFASKAYYYIKAFNHDFGTYHEVVVIFDDQYLSALEDSGLEPDTELFGKFWNWFNSVEFVDLESEELTGQIRHAYLNTLDIEKGDHLKVIRVA